jgi:hypothetical protein
LCRTGLVVGLCVLAGCQPAPPAAVNAGKARDVLKTALDSWKKGEADTALQAATPPIYIIDPEWQGGVKLIDFEILGDEEKDAHLFAQVKLTVRGPGGKDGTRTVTFIVSTAPNLTVSRKIF